MVLLGGGTGSFSLLRGLKAITSNITAIVSMSDDGGSTGILRDELGVLPPGDVRQCLVGLSDLPEVRELFSYRFTRGSLRGQSLGNIILSGLELQYDSFEEAIRIAGELLKVRGTVVPVTLEPHTLVAVDEKKIYRGEHVIDGPISLSANTDLYLDPSTRLNPKASAAILAADVVVIAPGSLYTSLVPLLLVTGMPEVLRDTAALVVDVANLVNKPGQTEGWHVVDYLKQLQRYLGPSIIDVVLYNNQPIEPDLLARYTAVNEHPVGIESSRFSEVNIKAVGAPLVSNVSVAKDPSDSVQRSFIRHDGVAVANELCKLLV